MVNEPELSEIDELRRRHLQMQVFRLTVILVYSLGLIPLAAFTILSADVWRADLGAMMPGLVLFFGSFAFFVGIILIQSDQYSRDKEQLARLEGLEEAERISPAEEAGLLSPAPEVAGCEKGE